MKRIILTLVTVFSMCCLVACGGESKNDTATGNNNEVVMNNNNDNPVTTAEATAEPTEEPELYPGIDMESDLPGAEWIGTFVGVVEEAKVIIYNDTTGRKEFIEEKTMVTVNPDEDIIAVYLPEGYSNGQITGISCEDELRNEYMVLYVLDSEKVREEELILVVVHIKYENEEQKFPFMIQPE